MEERTRWSRRLLWGVEHDLCGGLLDFSEDVSVYHKPRMLSTLHDLEECDGLYTHCKPRRYPTMGLFHDSPAYDSRSDQPLEYLTRGTAKFLLGTPNLVGHQA
jgi:hypothetical protein